MVGRRMSYEELHNTYGGLITEADFCTDHTPRGNIARRIAGDLAFDQQCKRNDYLREMAKGGRR